MHKAPANASPNEFHLGEDGSLQPGLKETQHRPLPSAEQTRAKLEELDTKTEEVAAAERAIEQKVADAKEAIKQDEERLRVDREEFEKERAAFRKGKDEGRSPDQLTAGDQALQTGKLPKSDRRT